MRLAVCLAIAVSTGCHGAKFGRLSGVRTQPGVGADGNPVSGDGCAPGGPGMNGANGNGQPRGGWPNGQQYPQGGMQYGPNGQPCGPNGQPYPQGGMQYGPNGQPCGPNGQPCPPQQCAPQQPRDVPSPPSAERVREREQVTESKSGAVTQDILLIPRTVYVPYAPHVPVAPARLSMATPAGRMIQTEERERVIETGRSREVEAPAAARDTRVVDSLDRCLDEMRRLNQRINDLETRAVRGVPGPCPPGVGEACPVPGPAAPLLHPPRVFGPGSADPPPMLPPPSGP